MPTRAPRHDQQRVQLIASSLYISSSQAIRALAGFSALHEQVRACLDLLPALEDPYNLPAVIGSLSREAQERVHGSIGGLEGFNASNPTGSYVLNLSQTVDFCVAHRLLTCWAVEVTQGCCRPAELEVRLSALLLFSFPLRCAVLWRFALQLQCAALLGGGAARRCTCRGGAPSSCNLQCAALLGGGAARRCTCSEPPGANAEAPHPR